MLINQVVFPVTTPERFDGNQVELTGLVTKIWARSTGDVFARLSIGEASQEEGNSETRYVGCPPYPATSQWPGKWPGYQPA